MGDFRGHPNLPENAEGRQEIRREQKIVHVEALCGMMEALTGDSRFTDLAGELLKKQKEGKEIAMCEYIDMIGSKRRKARRSPPGESDPDTPEREKVQ